MTTYRDVQRLTCINLNTATHHLANIFQWEGDDRWYFHECDRRAHCAKYGYAGYADARAAVIAAHEAGLIEGVTT